ncbi:MAG: acyl carrier protein [Paraglaciecola sp.]|jgi:acyl carrier protein
MTKLKYDKMTKDTILEKLRPIIQQYVEEESALDSITEETDLLQDLNINSIHLVDIILDVEEAFDIEIDDDAAEEMMTVGSAIKVIQARI